MLNPGKGWHRWPAVRVNDRVADRVKLAFLYPLSSASTFLTSLDRSVFGPEHSLHPQLTALRARLAPDALFWFRTCETFGGKAGHELARAWTDFFGCAAAGHSYVIGFWQSGLHKLLPGELPNGSVHEGFDALHPERTTALRSSPIEPNTITCMHGAVPAGY